MLTSHYGLPGQLADYRQQFEKNHTGGWDRSVDIRDLIGNVGHEGLWGYGPHGTPCLVRDRFIAGQDSCALCRHLDSVSLETPMQDIVDRCRVWESHADLEDQGGRRSLPVYTINDGGNAVMTYLGRPTILPRRPRNCWNHCCNICWPTPVVSPPKVTPIPSELKLLIQCLIGNDRTVQPAPTGRSSFTDMEVLIQNLFLVGPSMLEQPPSTSSQLVVPVRER